MLGFPRDLHEFASPGPPSQGNSSRWRTVAGTVRGTGNEQAAEESALKVADQNRAVIAALSGALGLGGADKRLYHGGHGGTRRKG